MKSNDIIIVSVTPWEGNYLKSTVELARELSANNKVWFLDYQFTLKDFIWGFLGLNRSIPWKRMAGLSNRARDISTKPGKSVTVFTPPPIIPAFWVKSYGIFSFFNRINQKIVLGSFSRFLRKKGARPMAVMSALNPFMGLGVKKYFPEIPHAYYCFDEIKAAHYLKIFGGNTEDILLQKVDAAIFTSDYLLSIKGKNVPKTAVIKNGVHFDNFARSKRTKFPQSPPKVGYLGSIDDRFDIDLMEKVIQNLPDIQFHFTGRVVYQKVPETLSHYTNVVFSPPVPSDEVPPIMGSMDIGIIPYIKNDFTRAVYPLKVNEYLSVGLPVIMTSFADLPDFKGYADIADDPQTFTNLIRKLLKEDSEEKCNARMHFAAQNSWKQRATDLEMFLQSLT